MKGVKQPPCILQVPCLADGEARLALAEGDPFRVQTKPHGHGDVHSLLHSSGLASRWAAGGVRWLCFFQDTNGLVFRALPAALGDHPQPLPIAQDDAVAHYSMKRDGASVHL